MIESQEDTPIVCYFEARAEDSITLSGESHFHQTRGCGARAGVQDENEAICRIDADEGALPAVARELGSSWVNTEGSDGVQGVTRLRELPLPGPLSGVSIDAADVGRVFTIDLPGCLGQTAPNKKGIKNL